MKEIGQKVLNTDLIDVFSASEGSINLYYGLIGNGKTYNATADILQKLKQGKVIYCNWKINVSDFDDRESILLSFRNLLFFKKRYYKIPCSKNLHFFDPDSFDSTTDLVEWLSKLNDCEIFFDEGQDMFDSYEGTRFSKIKRRLILHTRHYHRTLNIITQRPTAIQVSARGNVNRFYKCVKIASWPWVRFARLEYQEMAGETVDETKDPISRKVYWASPTVFKAYNTSYLADGIPKSQAIFFEAFDLQFKERVYVFAQNFIKIFAFLRKQKSEVLCEKVENSEVAGGLNSSSATIKSGAGSILKTPPEEDEQLIADKLLNGRLPF